MARASRTTHADCVPCDQGLSMLQDYECVTHLAEAVSHKTSEVDRFRRDVIAHSAFVVALPSGQFGLALEPGEMPVLSAIPYRLLPLEQEAPDPSEQAEAGQAVPGVRAPRSHEARITFLEESLVDLVRTHVARAETQEARIAEFWGSMEAVIRHVHGLLDRVAVAVAEATQPRAAPEAPPQPQHPVAPRIEALLASQAEVLQSSLFPVIKGLSRVEKALNQNAPPQPQISEAGLTHGVLEDVRTLLEGIDARLTVLERGVLPDADPASAEVRRLMAEVLADYRQRFRAH